jgi:Flp pilus assembly protein TadD
MLLMTDAQLASRTPEDLFQSGISHLRKHRGRQALEALRLAAELQPHEPRYISYYGLCLATVEN